MLAKTQAALRQPQARVPGHPPVAPEFVPLSRRVGVAEEFDLHLLEFARAEREIPRRNFVAEALADLRDAERNLHARTIEHVLEIDENALGRFGPQERRVFLAAHRADDRLEHQVELSRLGEAT